MTSKNRLVIWMGLLGAAVCLAARAPETNEVARLKSEDAEVRKQAAAAIMEEHRQTVAGLEALINGCLEGRDWEKIDEELVSGSIQGKAVPAKYLSAASAMLVLGELRSASSVPLLVRYLGFTPSKSVVMDHPVLETYPAAEALAKIGMPSLGPLIELYKERPNVTRYQTFLILDEVLGRDLMRAYLQSAIAAEKNPEKRAILKQILPGPQ